MGNELARPQKDILIGQAAPAPAEQESQREERSATATTLSSTSSTSSKRSSATVQLDGQVVLKRSKISGYFLELSELRLTSLTDSVSRGRHLRGLALSRNQLTDLPSSFSVLLNLCFLDLSHNLFTELPASLFKLSHLVDLKLSHNRLKSLPAEISSLSKLENLDLSHNQLEEVPASIGRLESLVSLNLSGNSLTVLPFEICKPKFLRHLLLEDCPLLPDIPSSSSPAPQKVASLKELSARVLVRHNIPLPTEVLPQEIIDYMGTSHTCSFCQGPFFSHHVSRFRLVQKSHHTFVAESRLCSSHWTSSKQHVMALFLPEPSTAPTPLEPARLNGILEDYAAAVRSIASVSRESGDFCRSEVRKGKERSRKSSIPSAPFRRRKASLGCSSLDLHSSSASSSKLGGFTPLEFLEESLKSMRKSSSSLLRRNDSLPVQ